MYPARSELLKAFLSCILVLVFCDLMMLPLILICDPEECWEEEYYYYFVPFLFFFNCVGVVGHHAVRCRTLKRSREGFHLSIQTILNELETPLAEAGFKVR